VIWNGTSILVARSGVGKARLSALIAAVHAEIAGWRATDARATVPVSD
jgi:hypothetical protein